MADHNRTTTPTETPRANDGDLFILNERLSGPSLGNAAQVHIQTVMRELSVLEHAMQLEGRGSEPSLYADDIASVAWSAVQRLRVVDQAIARLMRPSASSANDTPHAPQPALGRREARYAAASYSVPSAAITAAGNGIVLLKEHLRQIDQIIAIVGAALRDVRSDDDPDNSVVSLLEAAFDLASDVGRVNDARDALKAVVTAAYGERPTV